MSAKTSIEWTDATWNPTRGCAKISPGCRHCYASVFAERFRGVTGHAYEFGFDPRIAPEMLAEPLAWAKPRRIFVNSMSDLFHDAFPDEYLVRVCEVMQAANWHTFQVLTKRPERMRGLLETKLRSAAALPHVWWGVSVEDNRHGVSRIATLLQTPARVRFLSIEPLLERLDLRDIHWVIVGGESGPGARPILLPWVREIRDRCVEQGMPFLFKQWGGVRPDRTGRTLDGRTHDAAPASSTAPVLSHRRSEGGCGRSLQRAAPAEVTVPASGPEERGYGGVFFLRNFLHNRIVDISYQLTPLASNPWNLGK